ncbi:MAG: HAD family hydrolase [Alloprevotella sp.]|nr:HAD family hydrolase [Alloprevotella sp.]MBR1645108.1 HAD family hydrolase [Bacteroidales bacterium]MBR1652568.1 HAD family hydrolase [Alloprevotella sp.]
MNKFTDIKTVIFDYGGTLDTNSRHWANVLWEAYQHVCFPMTEEQFREAYVFGERALAKAPIVKPDDDFFHLLLKKVEVEIEWLEFNGTLKINGLQQQAFILDIAKYCNELVLRNMEQTKNVLEQLKKKYNFILVSNFYGNIHTVLKTYGIDSYFPEIVESSVVGVRKPDPRIWEIGVERAGCKAEECVVVADNFKKDIAPAHSIGCRTIWLKGEGWLKEEEADMSIPDAVVTDLKDVPALLLP